MYLIKRPFDAEAGVAHKAAGGGTGEVIGELDLGSNIQIRALKPPSDVIPQLRLGDEDEGLGVAEPLSPDVEESREPQSRRRAEIITSPDKGELQRHLVMDAVVGFDDVFIEQFEVEDVLVIGRVEAVVESDECGMVDAVSAQLIAKPV